MPWMSVAATETAEDISSVEAVQDEAQSFQNGYFDLEDGTLEEDKYPVVSLFSVRPETAGEEQLPAAYRSDQVSVNDVTVNYLPQGFRHQGAYGTCWAFSALGACEASLIRKGIATRDVDLSERHLAYYFYNKGNVSDPKGGTYGDYNEVYPSNVNYLSRGNNSLYSMWHLASWCGPVSEDIAPYSGLGSNADTDQNGLLGQENSTQMAYGSDACHVQNVYQVALGDMNTRIEQKADVKKLIMEYGALGISYYAATNNDPEELEKYDSVENNSFYNYETTDTNHAVQVVGWDDNFPAESFVKAAPGDGAWLIKNSWGNEGNYMAQSGYFWLSYYDWSVNYDETEKTMPYAFVFDAEAADNYDHIYQYDGESGNGRVSFSASEKVANRFTAGDGNGTWEVLRAVGIGVAQSHVSGTVEIYKNLTDPSKSPVSGEKVYSEGFSLEYPGYHTIKLDEEILLPDGCEFSVVFSFDAETEVYISRDMQGSFVTFYTYGNPGSSFIQWSGGNWSDLVSDNVVKNGDVPVEVVARIKAYTDTLETSEEQELEIGKTQITLEEGSSEQISASASESVTLTWNSQNAAIATVTPLSGNQARITAVAPGETIITVSDGIDTKQCKVTVTKKAESGSDDSEEEPGGGSTEAGDEFEDDDIYEEEDDIYEEDDGEDVVPAVLTKLSLNKTKATLVDGKKLQLEATPTYSGSNVTDWMVYWKSSDSSVAKVTDYGKVTAVNPGKATITVYNGNIKASCVITVKPAKTTLSSVSLTSTGKAKLKWKKNSGVTGYEIYRATSETGKYKKVKTISKASTVTATLASYTGSKPYYYKIRAYKTISGKKVYGDYSAVKTCGPAKVSSVKASAKSGKKIKLTWKKTYNASGYEIYRATSKKGKYKKIKTITKAKTVSYTNKSLKKGKKYYYKIRAYRLIKGKKVYGSYSSVVSAKAK